MKNIINKNAFYTLLGTVKKALTHNRCDSCGFTKEQVYVTEHFTESGWIECKPCFRINRRRIKSIKPKQR